MTNKIETFTTIMESFRYRYDLRSVFDDFLTMCLCAFSFNPETGKSYHEELYLETIGKYKKDEAKQFPSLLATLVTQFLSHL
jgi:hypothetical protein